MTGLSILFNMSTDEACYVYGHMESHRRTNEQSIQQRCSGLLTPGRHRNVGDHRYTGSTDLTSYTPTYSNTSPRYRSNYGYTDFPRESYTASPTTISSRSLYTDGDSMSKYTRGYDTSRNSSDYTTKTYDSPRLYDRGKLGIDRPGSDVVSPLFEFGVSYKSPRTHDTNTKNHDITTTTYDRNSRIDDVTNRNSRIEDDVTTLKSPAWTTSLNDRNAVNKQAHAEPPVDRPRQRLSSGDSSSSTSISSEKSGTEDRSLFGALKHRYKENAEKQYDDSSARSPFSSWRRSGNFEEVTSPIAPEAQKEKTKSLERKTYHRESDKDFLQRDSYHDEVSRSDVKKVSASSEKQADMSTDDLIFNFRQALRRHALSESEKALEHDRSADSSLPKIDIEADATAHRLERLRAARAKIHEQRQSDKVHSQSFATEFKGDKDKKDKFDNARSGSTSSVSSQKSDKDRVNVEEQEAKGDDQKLKHSTKLARQKLVSDDLRAKYMIKRDDEKDKTEPDDILSQKRSDRKERLKEHTEFWSKENDESVPTMEEMLLGSSQLPKSSSLSKKFQNVDHSSPFGSVYSKPSDVVTTTSSPISSSSSSTAVTTKASSSNIQPEKVFEKLKNETLDEKKKTSNQTETNGAKELRVLDKKEKRYKKYAKAKSLELGALSKQENVGPENIVQTRDDTHVDNVTAEELSQMSRLERIAKYKEERRKQLKTIQDRFAAGDTSELPSLFMSSKSASEESNVLRSKSMKVESDTKQAISSSAIPRSISMKQDKDHDSDHSDSVSPAFSDRHKMPGLRLAEIGTRAKPVDINKEKDVYEPSEQKYNTDNIIDKLHALKKLKEEHCKELNARHDDAHKVKYTKESHVDDIGVGKPVSYASRALLADRIMESSSRGNAPSPSRELRDKTVHTRHPPAKEPECAKHPSVMEPEQKSYFEFGTVFTKKETKVANAKPLKKSGSLEMKSLDDKDSDSGRDSAELTSRIRRRLPSLEDILGTQIVDKDKLVKFPKDAHAKIVKDSRINREPMKELTKEELLTMTADEINRRKVAENIEKAKHRFLEEEKHSGSFDASKFELGTVYTSKRDKPEKSEVCDKTVRDEMKPTENISKQDSLERTRQIMLGVVGEKEDHLRTQRKSHKIDKQGTDFAQARKETYLSHMESKNLTEPAKLSHKLEKEIKEEKMPQRSVKETKEEEEFQKAKKDVFSKPPYSPRNERRKQAEQKFGKVSYRSNEAAAFEFGTIYSMKEPVVSKQEDVFKDIPQSEFESKKKDSEPILEKNQETRPVSRPVGSFRTKEKSHEQIYDELKKDPVSKATIELDKSKIPTLDLSSRKIAQKDIKQETETVAAKHPISPLRVKPESPFKFDIKSLVVSAASGQNVEVPLSPTSPRRLSPCRVFADTFKGTKVTSTKSTNVPETVSSTPALKPMTFDIKSSKTSAAIMPMELPKVVQQETSKLEKIPSLEKADKTPVQTVRTPTPERQTSFTSFEIKSPSGVKSPETKVDKTVETSKSGAPKERSEFNFENVCQTNINAELNVEQQKQVTKKSETKVEQKQKVIKTPETKTVSDSEKKVVIDAKQRVKGEKSDISLFEMKKKQVEERLEHKHENIMDEKSGDKQEKKSEVFEMHMKQIAEKLEPKWTIPQVEEKVIGIHEIDSEMFEMHRKQIEEKLEPKHAHAHVEERVIGKDEQNSEIPKKHSKQIQVKKVEKHDRGRKVDKHKHDKSRIEKPVQTKLRMEKAFLDTNLDDILSKNVEYLSDLEPPDLTRGRSGAKRERPQSIHEHHRGKRVLKKKVSSQRSKSEDRSHFKVTESDEDVEDKGSSRVTEDLPRSPIKTNASLASDKVTDSRTEAKCLQQPVAGGQSQQPVTAGHSLQQQQQSVAAGYSQQPTREKESDKKSHQSVSVATPRLGSQNLENNKPVLKEEYQSVTQSKKCFDNKQEDDEHQAIIAAGIQKSSAPVSEMLYGANIRKETHESVADVGQVEFVSGMASDMSDLLERRRFVTREGEPPRVGTDSDQSASSAMSEGSRKRRKDKSSMRKSKLNESSDDASTSGRRLDSSDDSSKPSRVGVRRVASSRLARESREDKYKGDQQEVFDALKKHDLEISLTRPRTSPNCTAENQSTDKHAINTDHKHLCNIDSPRIVNKSVVDSHSLLPSRFALPSKVSAAISRLSESSDGGSKENLLLSKKTDENQIPKRIRRGNNFSQLLQKFSGSEASSSERSDSESPRRSKVFLKRQEACAVSSGSSDETRRALGRTQSLRLNKESPVMERDMVSSVQRSSSFKSDFMKRRFSPEPVNRRRLPDSPVEQSDQPSPELAKVLSKRNEIVAKQQEDGEVVERQRIHDGKVEKANRFSAACNDAVIEDTEVLNMLKSRREETDSSVSESENKSQKLHSHVESALKTNTTSQSLSQASRTSIESDKEKRKLQSQSSVESKSSVNLSKIEKEKVVLSASHLDKSQSAKSKSQVPNLDLTSIDTSLEVLKSVTDDLDNTKHSGDQFSSNLSHLKVTSPTQVADFIKTVESDSHRKQKPASINTTRTAKEQQEQNVVKSAAIEPKVQSRAETIQRPVSPTSLPHGSINITNKSEIMRKISTRERTPERQSPKRSGPMKVMTPMQIASGSVLTRTESFGRSESERPKGILKRTPSLKQSGVIVDPELAEVLKNRRQRHDDVDEEDEDQKLTAEEEIRQAREEQKQDDREVSVAERIFQMHTKIEEVKSCPITPKARSGFNTPKSALQRSGNISPKTQFSFDEGSKQPELSGSQLIERLTSLEGSQSNISEKRQKFLQRHRRDDARTRTQPVTLQEIQLADSLETVRKFRSVVIKKASINVFEALQKEDKYAPLRKTEFPQELRLERRPRNQRHKTLPVTAAELNAIPEDKPSETMNSLKKKFESFGARDSKADSGILSGSEGEILIHETESWRSSSMEENISADDPVKLSVSAKASMFLQIQESLKERQEKKSASGAKRYIDRKKRERSRTLPITEDEVKLAAEIADKEEEESKKGEETPVTIATEEEGVADELSRQSLKDKVKLFTTIEEEKKVIAQKKGIPPPPKRKNRKHASRFATQPVTYEEVEKAAKISPLACSLVKPPDPDILSGLSVKAQQELMAQHARQTLSQPSSRSGSKVPSRATSISDLSAEVINKDSLTVSNTDINKNYSALDTGASGDSVKPSDIRTKGFEVKPHEERHSSQTVEKITTSKLDTQKKNILKSQLEEKLSLLHKGPVGLLRPNSDIVPTISDINKALNKETAVDSAKASEVKGILKKEGSFETRKMDVETSAINCSELTSDEKKLVGSESDDNVIEGLESSGDNLDSDEGLLEAGNEEYIDTPVKRRENKARRRFNRDKKLEQERYKTQPTDGNVASPESSRAKKKYVGRHFTQPVTPDEKQEAEIATEMPEVTKSGSIHDRLNALKKSGDEGWKKRVSRPGDLDQLERRSASPEVSTPADTIKMREKTGFGMARPSSIADRLTALDSAQEGWRGRVGETDAKQFTIEHKITSSGQSIGESPLVTRLRGKTPRKEHSRDSESSENSDLISPTSPTKPLPREVVCPDLPADMLVDDSNSLLTTIRSVEEESTATTVSVPNMGAELDNFFLTSQAVKIRSPELEVSVDDFNELFLSANDMLETTRRAKPKRRYNTKSRNPLKTMSAYLEVKSEYTEVIHGVAERELKNVKVAALQQNSGFAVEALAGLASMENFAKVELRKTESNGAGTPGSNTRLEPYLPLMLIHVKGRRRVQCRLVEPKAESVNSGDCYVLITPNKNIQWIGDYCNVIEKAKAADICDFVKQKRDLGCKHARDVMTLDEKKGNLGNARYFWDLLGGYKPYMASGSTEEDELYETHVVETNMIYKLENNKLVPVQELWGNQPKYEMLQSNQVFVFDFGSELYLWQGKAVPPNQRKISLRLARQLWDQGYDYTKCEINPISPLRNEDEGGLPNANDKRPDWALFGKVNQNMETILFREKFADWPDTSRLIKAKGQEETSNAKFDLADLKAYDAKLMVPVDMKPVSTVLEGSNVGRGTKWEQDMEGFMKEQEIQTIKVRIWHVLEYDHYEIEDHSYGQFHEGDTYVVRWQYMIVNAGMKSLKGNASRFSHMGRERCAYFFWQGKSSTINEKGASALMTVELDEERGPQVRVSEGKEPPCFLNLFKGRTIIHIGKREEEETNTEGPWRFYCLRNEYENEMCLIEVPKDINNLRSVSSCIFLNVLTGKLTVWHGCKSADHTRKLARKAAESLHKVCPMEVGVHKGVTIEITEIEEGHERTDFWRMMNVHIRDRSKYHCLLDNPESFNHTLRLFHMTSVSCVFEAQEILNPSRTQELPTRFPVLQTDLYMVQQPALFLIDNGHEVYLWQGWWPEGDEDQENVHTGSAQTRFTVDRRCSVETTLAYCKEINTDSPPPAYMVYAGLEPLSFTNLFPFWTVDENVREINLRDGKTEAELVPVQDLLKKLTKTRYTFAELLETPLPEGVDPLKLESYLSDDEFEAVLEMPREDFYALPGWKQQKLKQQAELF